MLALATFFPTADNVGEEGFDVFGVGYQIFPPVVFLCNEASIKILFLITTILYSLMFLFIFGFLTNVYKLFEL